MAAVDQPCSSVKRKHEDVESPESKLNADKKAKVTVLPQRRSWVDDPDPSMLYKLHLGSETVKRYLQWNSLPLVIPRALPRLLREMHTPTLSALDTKERCSRIHPFTKLTPTTWLVQPIVAEPRYQIVTPLIEIKEPSHEDDPITFRFLVPTSGWIPIPGTAELFPENQKLYEEAQKSAPPGTKVPPITRGRHAVFKIDLPLSFQQEDEFPFLDIVEDKVRTGELKPWTVEASDPTMTAQFAVPDNLKLPRLRGDDLNVAVAFREKLAQMQRQSYFARFTFDQMVQWLQKCVTQWGEQLDAQAKNKADRLITHPSSHPPQPVQPRNADTKTNTTVSTTGTQSLSVQVTATTPPLADSSKAPIPGDQEVATMFEVPTHWAKHRTPRSVEKVLLDPDSEERKRVENWFLPGLPTAKMGAVYRVQNGQQWDKYQYSLRQHCSDQPEGVAATCEKWLWHGTTKQKAASIVQESFDMRLCKPPNLWGRGIYFSTRPDYTHHYSKPDEDNIRYVFLSRVLVGQSTIGRADHTRPPKMSSRDSTSDEGIPPRHFTTTTDDASPPSIYVVYDNGHCYPTYLIEYEIDVPPPVI